MGLNVQADVRDDLLNVHLREVRLAGPVGPHRHLLELLGRAQAALEHSPGFGLVFRNESDGLFGETPFRFEGGLFVLFELELGFRAGLFEGGVESILFKFF